MTCPHGFGAWFSCPQCVISYAMCTGNTNHRCPHGRMLPNACPQCMSTLNTTPARVYQNLVKTSHTGLNPTQQACTGPPTELALGSAYAYRTWSIGGGRHRRTSVLVGAFNQYWWNDTMEAECQHVGSGHKPFHQSPGEDCTCGIYAYSDPNLLTGSVIGAVECSGLTLIGTKGIRTQRAKIVALALNGGVTTRTVPVMNSDTSLFTVGLNEAGETVYTPKDGVELLGAVQQIVNPGQPMTLYRYEYVYLPAPGWVTEMAAQRYPEVRIFCDPGDLVAEYPASDIFKETPDA